MMLCYHNHAESKHLPAIQPILQRVAVQSPALSCLLAGDHPDLVRNDGTQSPTGKLQLLLSFLTRKVRNGTLPPFPKYLSPF